MNEECSAVESLVVSVYVKKDGGQDTSLWQAVLLFYPSATLIVRFHIEPPDGQHILDYYCCENFSTIYCYCSSRLL